MERKTRKLILGLAILISGIALLANKLHVSADTSTNWLNPANPGLEKIQDLAPTDSIPPTVAGLGNRDCINKTVTTLPAKLGQAEQTVSRCFVETGFGLAESNGTMKFSSAGVAGTAINYTGYQIGVIPIPNSYDTINYTSAGQTGQYLHFTRNLPAPLDIEIASTGQVTYRFSQPAQASLRDKANNLLPAQTNSLSFSSNGKWMIVDSPFKAMLRVNVDTLEVLPFTNPFVYNTGIDPGAQTAVSGDGRYAVVYSRDFSIFKIFDLATCPDTSQVPNTINGPVNCQSRDLLAFMKAQIPSFIGVSHIRFTSNNSLELYAGSNPGGVLVRSKYSLSAPGQTKTTLEYLGLGDSFASGEGAYNYRDGTDTSLNKCHLSQASYPYLIRDDLNLNSFASVACSGAKIDDVTNETNEYEGQVKDHISKENRDVEGILSNFEPGFIDQLDFIKRYTPNATTISTFGNDMGFKDKIVRCLGADTCYDTYESRLEVIKEVNSKFSDLADMYKKIKDHSNPTSKIYALGYPQVGLVGGDCGANVHLTSQELDFARLFIDYLNDTVHRAADKAGVGYVDVSQSLFGHRLCETTYSNTGINGITVGDDIVGVVGNESYHPNALGHRLLEQTILGQTMNLTANLSNQNSNATAVPINDSLPILQVPHAGGVANNTRYDDKLSNDTVFKQTLVQTDVDGRAGGLKPSTTYSLSLHSDPVDLGTFTTDNSGNLSAQFTIPSSVPTGFHTLHLQGNNIAGEPIDIYKTIYVAANQEDLDGDGTPNASDPCVIIEPSGNDVDMDGIDDACDGDIGEPPAPPTISFTSPEANSTVSGTTQINVSAEDQRGIKGVVFKLDGTDLGDEDTTAPYEYDLDTTVLTNGQHTLSATAKNSVGLTTTVEETITVYNNTPPAVNIIAPQANSTIGGMVQLSAEVTDNQSVQSVQFQVDGQNVGDAVDTPPYIYGLDTHAFTNGNHTLTAIAQDNEGLTNATMITVNVYNLPPPPTVTITSPTAGATLSGTVIISANAMDTEGVAGVQFKLDGQNLGQEQTIAPYSYSWDTKSASNGQHTVSAVARSVNGQTTTVSATVTVQNQTTQPSSNPIIQVIKAVITIIIKIVTSILRLFR